MTDTTRLAPSSRELPLEPGGEVDINLTSSDVRLRAVETDRVTVRTRDGSDIEGQVVVEGGSGHVLIREADRGFILDPRRLRPGGGVDLEIDVPASARVSLRTLSGDVHATGIPGPSRWASASGDVRLAVVGGEHRVESMSGDVEVEATAPIALRARTVSGDLRVRAPRLESTGIATTSGDIRIEAQLGVSEAHTVTSVSGDVELVTSSPVRVETQTIAGDVVAAGTFAAEGGRGRRTHTAGDGSILVTVRTTSGDIQLRAHAPMIAPTPPTPPTPPTAPKPPSAPVLAEPSYVVAEAEAAPNLVRPAREDDRSGDAPAEAWLGMEGTTDRREAARLDILRALERGELDIEGASHRLEQLEEAGPRHFRGWC